MDDAHANTNSQDLPRPGLGGSHHLPPYNILCAWPWDQHPNDILSRDSQVRVSKFPKLGLFHLWRPITLCANLWLRWSLKKISSPCWELSNGMSHATWMQGNRGDSWLLMFRNQIANLALGPSFGHNLCLKCPNGSCELILDIYVPRDFQWYKELFNPMGFDPYNCSLKISKSIETPIPKVGAHLGVWMFILSHFPTLMGAWDVTPGFLSWLTPLQPLALIVSPRLGLRLV
jgi:hypothetical protein